MWGAGGWRQTHLHIQILCSCAISPDSMSLGTSLRKRWGLRHSDFWLMGGGGLVAVTS